MLAATQVLNVQHVLDIELYALNVISQNFATIENNYHPYLIMRNQDSECFLINVDVTQLIWGEVLAEADCIFHNINSYKISSFQMLS